MTTYIHILYIVVFCVLMETFAVVCLARGLCYGSSYNLAFGLTDGEETTPPGQFILKYQSCSIQCKARIHKSKKMVTIYIASITFFLALFYTL